MKPTGCLVFFVGLVLGAIGMLIAIWSGIVVFTIDSGICKQ